MITNLSLRSTLVAGKARKRQIMTVNKIEEAFLVWNLIDTLPQGQHQNVHLPHHQLQSHTPPINSIRAISLTRIWPPPILLPLTNIITTITIINNKIVEPEKATAVHGQTTNYTISIKILSLHMSEGRRLVRQGTHECAMAVSNQLYYQILQEMLEMARKSDNRRRLKLKEKLIAFSENKGEIS